MRQGASGNVMSRLLVPFATPDLSSFAKALKKQLDERAASGSTAPTHLQLLNLLARAAGQRNFATLKAAAVAKPVAPAAPRSRPATPPVEVGELSPTARKALLQFDEAGR